MYLVLVLLHISSSFSPCPSAPRERSVVAKKSRRQSLVANTISCPKHSSACYSRLYVQWGCEELLEGCCVPRHTDNNNSSFTQAFALINFASPPMTFRASRSCYSRSLTKAHDSVRLEQPVIPTLECYLRGLNLQLRKLDSKVRSLSCRVGTVKMKPNRFTSTTPTSMLSYHLVCQCGCMYTRLHLV